MNKKEQKRWTVLNLSLRYVRRLVAAYRKEDAAALAHGDRGRKPHHALDENLRKRVLELAQSTYAGCNTQHFTELLDEREGIRSSRKRRPPRHRSRRERYPKEGMLVQIDGSRHDFLEGRDPWLNLIGAIDDATGKVFHALFREQEDAQGYFLLLR